MLAAFYYFLVFDSGMTQQQAITEGKARIVVLQQQLADAQQKLDSAAVYKKTAAEVGSTINKLLSLIPEKFQMNDLQKLASNEVKVAGSSLNAMDKKEPKVSSIAPEFEELTVTIDVQGSFLQHMVLLSNLTKVQQILIVRKFAFEHMKDGKGDESPTVRMTAEIVAFRYRGIDSAKGAAPGTPGVPGAPGAIPAAPVPTPPAGGK